VVLVEITQMSATEPAVGEFAVIVVGEDSKGTNLGHFPTKDAAEAFVAAQLQYCKGTRFLVVKAISKFQVVHEIIEAV
jgi:hypothetical protein